MTYVIMAAGDGTRWNNYLGVPKHLASVTGETLLERTQRLLKENGVTDIVITTKENSPNYTKTELDRFLNALPMIMDGACFLYGDVYYTENAIKTAVTMSGEIMVLGRSGPSAIGGKRWGEIYAIKVKSIRKLREVIDELLFKLKTGRITRAIGWEVYHQWIGTPLSDITYADPKTFIHIDDFTDDFDTPEEYEDFLVRLKELEPEDVYKDLGRVLSEKGIQPKGVLHIGGHLGQEGDTYRTIGFDPVVFVEPIPAYAQYLRGKGETVMELAVSNVSGTLDFHVTSYAQGSSLLAPIQHEVVETIPVETMLLSDILTERFNTLSLDVQGSELDVLSYGVPQYIDCIVCELSDSARYRYGSDGAGVTEYLLDNSFDVVGVYPHKDKTIQDAIFIRTKTV